MMLYLNSFVLSLACFYVSSKILKSPINYRKLDYWLILLINALLITLSFITTTHFLKVVFNYVVLVILNKLYFKKKMLNIIISSFGVFLLTAIGEILSVILVILMFNVDPSVLSESYTGTLVINVGVSFFLITIINIKKSGSFFSLFYDNIKIKGIKSVLLLIAIIVFICSAYFYYLYFNIKPLNALFLSISLIIIITILSIFNFKERIYSFNLKREYDELINNLNEYEKILEKYRITNHENKNNFIVLKGMIKENKNNAIKQIDEIISSKQNEDEEVLIKTKKLPTGGLQGLIYQKILTMKEKSILYNLEISRKIDVTKFKNFDFELNKNLCTIVGILIDNAIEAVEELENKNIGICFYKEEDSIVLSISNTFLGIIDIDKMDNIGYSSKGKGRGYGLSIIKKITEKDKRISLEREIIKNLIKQKIKIKM